jgi:hypothetical protein
LITDVHSDHRLESWYQAINALEQHFPKCILRKNWFLSARLPNSLVATWWQVDILLLGITLWEWLVRIKGKALVVVITCMGTALAMAFSGREDSAVPDVVGAAENKVSIANRSGVGQHEQVQPDIDFDLSAIKRTMPDKIKTTGLFQSKSWYTPPPQPQAPSLQVSSLPPPPPPPPSAPQLPFTFIGRMIDGSDVTLFLTNNNQQYSVKLSDVLDGSYRVDKITDKSAVLTYLPMNIQQELVFNSTAVGISSLSASASNTIIQPPTQSRQQIEISR